MGKVMFLKLISFLLLVSCSTNMKKEGRLFVDTFPGDVIKVTVPSTTEKVECDKKELNIIRTKEMAYFLYAESYFSKSSRTCFFS